VYATFETVYPEIDPEPEPAFELGTVFVAA